MTQQLLARSNYQTPKRFTAGGFHWQMTTEVPNLTLGTDVIIRKELRELNCSLREWCDIHLLRQIETNLKCGENHRKRLHGLGFGY